MSELHIHDSNAGKVVKFESLKPDEVNFYVCGPTVYGPVHVGNARPIVIFDVLYRLLSSTYAKVRYVRNITDIDDKIIEAAKQEGVEPSEIATKYRENFEKAVESLGNLEPTDQPCATNYIDQMIEMSKALIKKNHAYEAEGHVLFAVASYPTYGSLSNRNHKDMVAGARVEIAPYKKDPADFVLWKPSQEDQPGWDSPWGRGRPGWHLECSAMIHDCIGNQIDIHGGGIDLLFPHHENENAQSCCALGLENLASYWMHNGHITSGGDKMSKSKGNYVELEKTLSMYPPEASRYALLSAHYRGPLDWRIETVVEAKTALDRLYRALAKLPQEKDTKSAPLLIDALNDDLNTPKALSVLHSLASKLNLNPDDEQLRSELYASAKFLGLFMQTPESWFHSNKEEINEEQIEELIKQRIVARKQGDYAKADSIRKQLEDQNILLEDKGTETVWRSK